MIPVPYDRPVFPPMLYSLETFPTAINTTYMALIPGAERMMNKVIVAVANEISSTANTTNLRMFAYNMLSSNGWSNKYFQEACQFTANYVALSFAHGQNQDADGLIKQAVMLICCVIASTVPAFYNMLDQNNQLKIAKNTSIYKEINNNILSAIQSRTMAGNMGMGMGMGMNAQMVASGMVNPAVNGLMAGQTVQQKPVHSRFGPLNQSLPEETKPVQVEIPVATPVINQPAITLVTSDIGSVSMDREKHSVVYAATTGGQDSVAEHVQQAIIDQAEKLDRTGEGQVFLNEDSHDSNSLDVLLQMVRSDHIADAVKSVRIHHDATRVLEPIFSAIPVDALFEELYRCNTFERVAEILRRHYADGLESDNPRSVLATVSILDRRLTDELNRFLKSLSSSRKLSISSFIEDVPALPGYIRTKLGNSAFDAYSQYHARAMKSFFKEQKKDNKPPVYYIDGEKDYGYFTVSYGISYLTTSLIECGVGVFNENHDLYKVSRQTTPLLYKMLKDASDIVASTGSINHIFMTLDGLCFTVELPVYDQSLIILAKF